VSTPLPLAFDVGDLVFVIGQELASHYSSELSSLLSRKNMQSSRALSLLRQAQGWPLQILAVGSPPPFNPSKLPTFKTLPGIFNLIAEPPDLVTLCLTGMTVHSWGAVAPGQNDIEKQIKNIRSCKPALNRWKTTKVLVIDEGQCLS